MEGVGPSGDLTGLGVQRTRVRTFSLLSRDDCFSSLLLLLFYLWVRGRVGDGVRGGGVGGGDFPQTQGKRKFCFTVM